MSSIRRDVLFTGPIPTSEAGNASMFIMLSKNEQSSYNEYYYALLHRYNDFYDQAGSSDRHIAAYGGLGVYASRTFQQVGDKIYSALYYQYEIARTDGRYYYATENESYGNCVAVYIKAYSNPTPSDSSFIGYLWVDDDSDRRIRISTSKISVILRAQDPIGYSHSDAIFGGIRYQIVKDDGGHTGRADLYNNTDSVVPTGSSLAAFSGAGGLPYGIGKKSDDYTRDIFFAPLEWISAEDCTTRIRAPEIQMGNIFTAQCPFSISQGIDSTKEYYRNYCTPDMMTPGFGTTYTCQNAGGKMLYHGFTGGKCGDPWPEDLPEMKDLLGNPMKATSTIGPSLTGICTRDGDEWKSMTIQEYTEHMVSVGIATTEEIDCDCPTCETCQTCPPCTDDGSTESKVNIPWWIWAIIAFLILAFLALAAMSLIGRSKRKKMAKAMMTQQQQQLGTSPVTVGV